MGKVRGTYRPLSPSRQLVIDLLEFARRVPSVPVQRRIPLGELIRLRSRATPRPSWCAILTKAYARVAARTPALRRAYMPYPWPRLYEHPHSIASIAIERLCGGEPGLFFAHVRSPDQQSLAQLQASLERFKHAPIESIGLYRRALTVSRLPRPLRRLCWWIGLYSSGPKRAKRMGTFGLSVYSSLGADSLHPLSPLTTTLNYGPIQSDGSVDVRIVYDHRVMDGATIARALADLERVLHAEIQAELTQMASSTTQQRSGEWTERQRSEVTDGAESLA